MARKRTMYNMTHQVATCSDVGKLAPFMVQEVAPGDTWSGKIGALIRLSPLNHALVQDIFVDMYVFYIPHRLVWANWEDFIADGPMDSPTYTLPQYSLGAGTRSSQALFLNSNGISSTTYGLMRTYAYNLVWNEFFRDDEESVRAANTAVGEFGTSVSYKKDYWTTLNNALGTAQAEHFVDANVGSGTQASALDILTAIARQKISLKRETYGSRYVDILRSYGVNVNYQMLQRPEVVGIGRTSINTTDVVATDSTGLGDLGGHGIGYGRVSIKRKSFPEHGTLLGLTVMRPRWMEKNAVDWFDRPRDYTGFYDPGLVPLPPVEVEKQDITPSMDTTNRGDTIGYWNWGDWYRKAVNRVHVKLYDNGWVMPAGLSATDFTTDDVRQCTGAGAVFSDQTYQDWQGTFVNKLRVLRSIPRNNLSTVTGMRG